MLRLLRLRNVARVAALALTLGSSLCAQAQVTPTSVQNQINAVPWTNGLGRVPGATFNSILTNLTVVLGQVYNATVAAPGASIFATGQVQTTSLLGTLQSAQAPVLTGDVLTSLGSFATVISPGAVTSSKMASGAAAGNLGPASVTASMLASGAAAGNLGPASVTASMLASGAAAGNLGPASVTASMLASGAAAGNLGPASVTASMLGLAYPPPGLGSYVFTGSSIGGTANAITVGATVPTGFTNTYGTSIVFTPTTLNTGPTTIAVGAASIENLYRQTPAGVAPMAGGELVLGQIAAATFDGVEFVLTSTGPTVPPGEVAMFNLATCPNGWLPRTGLVAPLTRGGEYYAA